MEEITWQSLATLPGAVAAVTLILTVLKAVIGTAWSDLVNRVAALIFSIAVVVASVAISGVSYWPNYILAVFNGLIVAQTVLGLSNTYIEKIYQEKRLESRK